MKKIVITFGLIAGGIVTVLVLATMPLLEKNIISSENSMLLGYTIQVISFSVIFFAIKSYRDNHLNGTIKFGKGLQIGLLITLMGSLIYALGWEFYFNLFAPDWMERYAEMCVQRARTGGMAEAELQQMIVQMDQMKEWYKNPIIRFGMTLMEILPVGIGISLLAAALLRKKSFLPTQTA